ncbi:hypothetical protein P7H20_00810 [Paenibacillus larvae]|nr:hypothetical protein [Paenibacillus larvae]MDT2273712.1 hypothetical protein [Paenibacillus larvae]
MVMGINDQSVDEILKCDKNHVNIIYTNSMNLRYVEAPIPLPLNSSITSNVNFSWTIATLSKANALHVSALNLQLRTPSIHMIKNTISLKKIVKLTFILLKIKIKFKNFYLMDTNNHYCLNPLIQNTETESEKRNELKWDTVVKKMEKHESIFVGKSILVLHGIGRNGSIDRIDYAVIVTISILNTKITYTRDF